MGVVLKGVVLCGGPLRFPHVSSCVRNQLGIRLLHIVKVTALQGGAVPGQMATLNRGTYVFQPLRVCLQVCLGM